MRLIRILAFVFLLVGIASAQSTTVIGTFRDGSANVITSGQVVATLQPGIDTVASGIARFTPTEVDCSINESAVSANQAVRLSNSVTISGLTGHTFIIGDLIQVAAMTDSTFNGTFTITGTTTTSITYSQTASNATSGGGTVSALRAIPGNGACTVATNTLVQPSNTSWKFCAQPGFIQPGSCFVAYALGGTLDISAVPATPSLTPAYNLMDTFSNQTIAGTKTFSGTVNFNGINIGSATLSGNLLASQVASGGANASGSIAGDTTSARSATAGAIYLGTDGHGFLLRGGDSYQLSGTTLTWTFPATSDTLVGKATTDTLTNKTLTSPIINGSPSGTGIPTVTLKKGSGAGNYTTASTTFVVADATNLCYTVTIPTGWKLQIQASLAVGTLTANVPSNYAISDNASCSTANSGILAETTLTGAAASAATNGAMSWVISGNGASHNIALQFKTSNASDSAFIGNTSATLVPTMTFLLTPSN